MLNWGDFVFVFGSNLAGRHGKGAALAARRFFGAQLGVGAGPTGRSYAIPTKDTKLRVLSIDAIARSVQDFVAYAKGQSQETFLVTRIGCGLAGYRDEVIAPLFADAPTNVMLPAIWQRQMRVAIFCPQEVDYEFFARKVDFLLSRSRNERPVLVCGAENVVVCRFAQERGLSCEVLPRYERHGAAATALRDRIAMWRATHCIVFASICPEIASLVELAKNEKVEVRIV